jgi:hypothetical protein
MYIELIDQVQFYVSFKKGSLINMEASPLPVEDCNI